MYKKAYNEKNAALFRWYATVLMKSGTSEQDYLQSEKFFLKSLSIDDNFDNAHNDYASLLSDNFYNYDKAEYHYNQSLTINPNNTFSHANFALFLIDKRLKYDEALSHSEKACKLKPSSSWAHFMKAESLYKLHRFDESLKEYQLCLTLHENDPILPPWDINKAKTQMNLLRNKIDKEKISQGSAAVSRRKNKGDEKTQERESQRMEQGNGKEFENEKNKYANDQDGEMESLQQQVDRLVCTHLSLFYYASLPFVVLNHFFR